MKTLSAVVALALLAGVAVAAEALKSGPQVNEKLAGPFHPLNINGPAAGEKNCLYCENGSHPVAMVFAREVTPAVTDLIKKIDAATVKNSDVKMGSFVVFCSNDKGLEKQLKALADEAKLKKCILAIDNPAGPEDYKVAKEADVTVVLYTDTTVKANFAFKKGELKEKDVEKILSELPKILPTKR
jgi:hypothetical protein